MVEVVGAQIRWNFEWASDPELEICVDHLPTEDEYVYDLVQSGGYTLAFAECDGVVRFFAHSPKNETGYGGSLFKINTKDGVKEFRGPWSSRSGVMNHHFTQSIDVHITDKPEVLEKGYTYFAGNITLDLAIEAVRDFLPGIGIVKVAKFGEDITYQFVDLNNDCDHGETNANNRCKKCRHMVYDDVEWIYPGLVA